MATPDRPAGFRIGSLLGFPIYIDVSLLLIVGIFALSNLRNGPGAFVDGLIFFGLLFATVMWHELGHAIAVRKLDLGESVIVLHGLGGVTRYRRTPSPKQGIVVALAGPGGGLLLAGVLWAVWFTLGSSLPYWATPLLYMAAWINLVINVGNLLPAFPLDGGQVLRFALMSKLPQARAFKATAVIGLLVLGAAATTLFVLTSFDDVLLWIVIALVAMENVRLWRAAGG